MSAPLTFPVSKSLSPELLHNNIDSRVVKIRPAATPLDQISRFAGARKCSSMQVEFYSARMKDPSSEVTEAVAEQKRIQQGNVVNIKVKTASIFSPSETIVIPAVTAGGKAVVGYINEIEGTTLKLIPVGTYPYDLPAIAVGAKVVRMGRAAGELDVQTSIHTTLPNKDFNLCQIFKTQIEESFYHRLADKEVGWTFNDQEEMAIMDMRLGIERSYLFGIRQRLRRPDGEEVLLAGGIWNQAKGEFGYSAMTGETLNAMMRKAFTNAGGSKRKVLLAGSGLIEKLSNLEHQRVVLSSETTTHWGIDFQTIVSKFGTLYVVLSEVFDMCGMPDAGMVIDPEYLTKYVHVPLSAERISFRKQGVRNTEAVVLTEASCLVLRYPDAHMRIVPEA